MYGRSRERARLLKSVGNNQYLQLLTIIIFCTLFSHVQGIVSLDPCTVGIISGTDVTILKNETDVFVNLTCVCDIQCHDHVALSISFRFHKTDRNEEENLRIIDGTSGNNTYIRNSNNKNYSMAYNDSLRLVKCNFTLIYQWRKQSKQNKTGYLRVNLTGSNSLNVMCKRTGYVLTTLNPELPGDVIMVTNMDVMPTESGKGTSDTSSSNGLVSNTIIIIAVIVPVVMILIIIILVVITFLRRRKSDIHGPDNGTKEDYVNVANHVHGPEIQQNDDGHYEQLKCPTGQENNDTGQNYTNLNLSMRDTM